jgi:hypothetical protein
LRIIILFIDTSYVEAVFILIMFGEEYKL